MSKFFKEFVFYCFILIFCINSFGAIEDRLSQAAVRPVQSASEDRKKELVDFVGRALEDTPQAFVHLFWATGRPMETLSADQRKVPILIGGKSYGPIFFQTLEDFLGFTPERVTFVMTCDHRTYEANSEKFTDLKGKFAHRFSIQFTEEVVATLNETHPEHREILELVFKNACTGNPVIACDIYRLLLRSLHKAAPERSLLAYSDIDAFCSSMEGQNSKGISRTLSDYLIALFNPKKLGYGGRSGEVASDIIKFLKNSEGETGDKNILKKLTVRDKSKAIIGHFPQIIKFLSEFEEAETFQQKDSIWQQYLQYAQIERFNARDIIEITGPRFASSIPEELSQGISYCSWVCEKSWYDVDRVLPEGSFDGLTSNAIAVRIMRSLAGHPLLKFLNLAEDCDHSSFCDKNVLKYNSGFCSYSVPGLKEMLSRIDQEEKDLGSTQKRVIESYTAFRSLLSDLGFLKLFWTGSSFEEHLESFLKKDSVHFFKKFHLPELIRSYYRADHKVLDGKTLFKSKEEWAKIMAYQLEAYKNGFFYYYLQKAYSNLGVDFSMKEKEIHQIVEDL